MRTLLAGGTVLGVEADLRGDVLIEDGFVVNVGTDVAPDGARIIDCQGAWVGPGFVDLHTHLREPGQEWKEDIASGSAAAAAGGYTRIVAMPNTDPAIDNGHLARFVAAQGRHAGLVQVEPSGCLTRGRAGAALAHFDDLMAAGVRLFTDDGDTLADAGVLRRAMEYLAELGGIVAQHAEEPGLARGGVMHEGSVSSRLGMPGLPALAETLVIERDLRLVEMTGCRYHVQHVSTAGGVELVRAAKAQGLPVTAEATPHHLALDHRLVLELDSVAHMYPPLRAPSDVAALREALRDGTIDAVATDHAPHAASEKDVPFEESPRGVIGLETAAAVVNTVSGLGAREFFERMAVAPARILGEEHGWIAPGRPADIVVFSPDRPWTPRSFYSKSANSPWLGRDLQGRVLATLLGGVLTHDGTGAGADA